VISTSATSQNWWGKKKEKKRKKHRPELKMKDGCIF
jgi:hypothetical protein